MIEYEIQVLIRMEIRNVYVILFKHPAQVGTLIKERISRFQILENPKQKDPLFTQFSNGVTLSNYWEKGLRFFSHTISMHNYVIPILKSLYKTPNTTYESLHNYLIINTLFFTI